MRQLALPKHAMVRTLLRPLPPTQLLHLCRQNCEKQFLRPAHMIIVTVKPRCAVRPRTLSAITASRAFGFRRIASMSNTAIASTERIGLYTPTVNHCNNHLYINRNIYHALKYVYHVSQRLHIHLRGLHLFDVVGRGFESSDTQQSGTISAGRRLGKQHTR